MVNKKSHTPKSYKERVDYIKAINKPEIGDKTAPEADLAATDSSAAEEDRKIEETKERPQGLSQRTVNWSKKYGFQILLTLFSGFIFLAISFLIYAYSSLNKDVGKIEERVKDIPALTEKVTQIDKNIELLKLEVQKSYELFDYKLKDLDSRLTKVENKK